MTNEYEKKMRYFVIGEDTPIRKSKVVPCGQFGVTEATTENTRKIQTVKSAEKNPSNRNSVTSAINVKNMSDFRKIADVTKSFGIEIKVNI